LKHTKRLERVLKKSDVEVHSTCKTRKAEVGTARPARKNAGARSGRNGADAAESPRPHGAGSGEGGERCIEANGKIKKVGNVKLWVAIKS